MDSLNQIKSLRIRKEHWEQMRTDVDRRTPEEACGLVAGKGKQSLGVFALTNVLHNPTRYRLDPEEQIRTFLEIEQHDWELIAIYHSHPLGPEAPSPTDIKEAAYPEAIYLIWSRKNSEWLCRGFMIQNDEVSDVLVEVMEV